MSVKPIPADKPLLSGDKTSDSAIHDDPIGMKFFAETSMTEFSSIMAKIRTGCNNAEVSAVKIGGSEQHLNTEPAPTDTTMCAFWGSDKAANVAGADATLKAKFPLPGEEQEAA